MSIAAAPFPARDRAGLARWGVSLAIVLLLHLAAGMYLISRHIALDAAGPQQPAVMIDLAPLPAPPVPQPAPPEPVTQPQVTPQAEPPPPEPQLKLPDVEPSPAPKPAVALPPKPPPKPKPRPAERPPEVPTEQHPPPPPAPAVAAPPAPPAAAAPAANAGALRATWQTQVAAQLERYKRYPRLAQEERQQGVATLQFALDRQGRVLSAQIVRGSGFSLLDEEVLALVRRAEPLPAPPPEIPGARIELTVPVQFSIRPGSR